MKKFLFILCACLFGALSGVKAWTSVAPQVGRSYYLFNVGKQTFWYAGTGNSNRNFGHTSDLSQAIPVYIERFDNQTCALSYHLNGVKRYFYVDKKAVAQITSDYNTTYYWVGDGYYYLGRQTDSRRMHAEDAGTCDYPTGGLTEDVYRWQFIAVEEVYNELIKSTAPTCAAAAEASYLKPARGWTKITELPANLDDYYYAIVSAEVPGIMLNAQAGNRNGNVNKAFYYATAVEADASQRRDFLWTIADNSSYDCQSIRNVEYDTYYMQTKEGEPWLMRAADATEPGEWTQLKFEYDINSTSWTILNNKFSGQYLGAWDKKVPENGLEFCGNNSKDGEYGRFVGHFLIYAVSKRDYTYKITNSDFSNGAAGWNGIGSDKSQQFFINTEARFTGNIAEMWKGSGEELPAGNVNQTISSLPAGTYTLSAKVFSDLKCELYATTAAKEKSLPINGCDLSTQSLEFAIAEAGNVTIGLRHNGESTNNYNWIAVDEFKLIYTGPYHEIDVNEETKTQTYEGTFTENVELTPTEECPFVNITGASFAGTLTANFTSDENGSIIATAAQKEALGSVKNVIVNGTCDNLVLTDGTDFVAPSDFTANSASYSRVGIKLSKDRYATVYLPYAFSTSGLKVMEYESYEDGVLTFTPVDVTEPSTPYLVRIADGGGEEVVENYSFSGSGPVSATDASDSYFKGTYASQILYASIDGYNYYGFSAKNGDFRQASATGNTCGAFRAYVKLPEATNARVAVRFDDGTTGIATLDADGNISGVDTQKDGKFLENGKIVIMKNGVKYDANGKKLN